MAKDRKSLPCGRKPEAEERPSASAESELCARLLKVLSEHVLEKGLRHSESRSQIVEVLAGMASHFSAADLIDRVRNQHPDIGAATVYRNLPTFLDAGVLRETLQLEGGERLFEVESGAHHDHIVCLDCHAIFEFHSRTIEKEQDSIASEMRFTPEGHRHVVYARCGYLKRSGAKK